MVQTLPSRHGRSAFSLVELLVVTAVVGALGALLLPAVQSARESARRTACSNNIKQLAGALLAYEASQGRLPPAAVVATGSSVSCSDCWNPWHEAGEANAAYTATHDRGGSSWLLEILPHIDQTAIANQWDRLTNVRGNAQLAQMDIAGLYCPSRRSGLRSADDASMLLDVAWTGGGTDYGGCYGQLDGFDDDASAPAFHRFNDRGANPTAVGGPFRTNSGVPLAAIVDGQTNQILLAELQRLPAAKAASGAAVSQDGWAVGGAATLFTTLSGAINDGHFESAGSDHGGGVTIALADGSVRFLSDAIDTIVYPLLGSMADGQIASIDQVNR